MKTIQELAQHVATKWEAQYNDSPDFFEDLVTEAIRIAFVSEVAAAAANTIQEKYNPDVVSMMDRAIRKWMDAGDIDVGAVPDAVKASVERVLHDDYIDKRAISLATKKRLHGVYKLRTGGASFAGIADRLLINESTARALFDKAEQRLASMRDEVAEFVDP